MGFLKWLWSLFVGTCAVTVAVGLSLLLAMLVGWRLKQVKRIEDERRARRDR